GNIIQQIQEGKYLVQQDKANLQNYVNGLTDYKNSMTAYKKQMLDWFVDTVDAGTDAMIMFMDITTAYSLSINKVFIEPAEKWV
ncbi:S-layer protein, partial [Bacillus thuringiensis]